MRILMISENFPPLVDAEAIVGGKFAQALSAAGAEVEVVAGDFGGTGRAISEERFWDSGLGEVTRFPAGRIAKRRDYEAKLGLRSEAANAWSLSAYQYCRERLGRGGYDLIISRTWSIMAAIVAYRLPRGKVPWVAVINDPYPESLIPDYTSMPWAQSLRMGLRIRSMRRMLSAATMAAFPGERLQRHLEKHLSLSLGDKGFVVPHIGARSRRPRRPLGDAGNLNLLHCGRLDTTRTSERFLGVLAEALRLTPSLRGRVKVYQIGLNQDPGFKRKLQAHGLGEVVQLHPGVGYEESLDLMAGADGLLLVEAVMKDGIFLPSKFIDYASSGRPVLMFSPEAGSVSDLVGGLGHPGFLGQDPAIAARRLAQFLEAWERGKKIDDYCVGNTERFSGPAMAEAFLAEVRKRGWK